MKMVEVIVTYVSGIKATYICGSFRQTWGVLEMRHVESQVFDGFKEIKAKPEEPWLYQDLLIAPHKWSRVTYNDVEMEI